MSGVVVCFLISLSLFLTLGALFERRERRSVKGRGQRTLRSV
jgi:hypothetical protein